MTVGTVFEKTRIPLTVWFEAAWLMTTNKGGISAAYLHRVLPIASYPTAWTMLAKLRQAMSQAGGTLLTGRVEVDETFIGGPRPGAPGRGAAGKTLVAGAIEIDADGWGRARLKIIPDASMASLRDFVTATIAVGTTVVSDGWPSYPGALKGYVHEPVNVSASGRPAHEALPAVHRVFALVKRMIEGTYQGSGSAGHLQEYLDEFVFRFNRRRSKSRGLVFMRLLQRAVGQEATTFRDLVRDSKPKPMAPSGKPGQHAGREPSTLPSSPDPGAVKAEPLGHQVEYPFFTNRG